MTEEDSNMRRLYVFGAGGSGRETAWLASQAWGSALEIVFVVDRAEYLSPDVNGFTVQLLADVEALHGYRFVVALGNPSHRRAAAAACGAHGLIPAQLSHPRAEISPWVDRGPGSVICAGSVVTTNVVVGAHVHINVDCTVSHDVRIGDFATLSPGVHVAGNVTIGEDVFIGTGASIVNGRPGDPLNIGDGAVIAAGACVTRSVDPGSLMAGVPAVRKK